MKYSITAFMMATIPWAQCSHINSPLSLVGVAVQVIGLSWVLYLGSTKRWMKV